MKVVTDSKKLISSSIEHARNSDYCKSYNEYSDSFVEFKGIPLHHDIKHYIELLYPYKYPI